MDTRKEDLKIISQLYDGNHLNDYERDRMSKLLYLLKAEFKRR